MWMPKWYWEKITKQHVELERRVKRLEILLYKQAEYTRTCLRDERAGSCEKDGFLAIEEIINQCCSRG